MRIPAIQNVKFVTVRLTDFRRMVKFAWAITNDGLGRMHELGVAPGCLAVHTALCALVDPTGCAVPAGGWFGEGARRSGWR